MCKIAVRCHPHTVAKLDSIEGRLASERGKLAQCEHDVNAALLADNSTKFMSARKRATEVEGKILGLQTKRRHTRRDVNGTPTGASIVDRQLLASTNPRNIQRLQERKASGALMREGRKHAAAHAAAGFSNYAHGGIRPPFFLKSEGALAA